MSTGDFDDVPGAYVDLSGVATPEGEWAYAVDDHVTYGPGPWPFYRITTDPSKSRPAAVRVSPDAAFYSWRNEYVRLGPSFWDEGFAEATLCLYLGRRGGRHFLVDGKIRLDLRARTASVHASVPAPVRDQAQTKADRLLRMVVRHRQARQAGAKRPVTAGDLEAARKQTTH
jgi:hypothetical protein